MTKVSEKAPKKIYLQHCDCDCGDDDCAGITCGDEWPDDDVTWCEDSVYNCDVEYIRSDIVETQITELKERLAKAEGRGTMLSGDRDKVIERCNQFEQLLTEAKEEIEQAKTNEIMSGFDEVCTTQALEDDLKITSELLDKENGILIDLQFPIYDQNRDEHLCFYCDKHIREGHSDDCELNKVLTRYAELMERETND